MAPFTEVVKRMFLLAATFFLGIAALCGPCFANENNQDLVRVDATVSDYNELKEILVKSISEAQEKGSEKVNIYLKEEPDIVQPSDLVKVDYTVLDPDGRIVYSTRQEMVKHIHKNYLNYFDKDFVSEGGETILAGFPGHFPGIGHAVLGLHRDQRRTISVLPKDGFGIRDEGKVKIYPIEQIFPKNAVLPVTAYLQTFEGAPETGKVINLSPFFESRVIGVNDGKVMLENLAENGSNLKDEYGTTTIAVQPDRIIVTLDPIIGGLFATKDKKGIVIKKDNSHFTVDYNHPLAGKTMVFDITVDDLKKFSAFEKIEIPWNEDHDAAMSKAAEVNKPLVLVLYAEWCQWSQRLLNITFADPRVRQYCDRFVWLKIDSDKENVYKEVFEQESYPMVVLMDANGQIKEKMEGFQDGQSLSTVLSKMIADDNNQLLPVVHTSDKNIQAEFEKAVN